MCGICGVFKYGQSDGVVVAETIERMKNAMLHRGPDEGGTLVDRDFGMGMRRLSIIDLAGGSQPIENEDGRYSIVFNGEIYNFVDLRLELEAAGHRFKTHADTEVILHGFEEWGSEVADRLNGMFAFGIWDRREREFFMARDHYGIKPLYFSASDGRLVFASELRSLFASDLVERAIDPTGLAQFFRYRYVPAPLTTFAGVRKLRPGYSLRVRDAGSCEIRRFARPPVRHTEMSEGEAVEALEAALLDAVGRQMIADVPVGLMLSGGVDSALIGNLMAERSSTPIKTFTVAFAEDTQTNELEAASASARRFGAEHHEMVISQNEYIGFLPASVLSLEEPVATPSTLALRRLSEFARSEVTAALTGQGADEPFGGYPRYAFEQVMGRLSAIPPALLMGGLKSLRALYPADEKLRRAIQAFSAEGEADHVEAVNRLLEETELGELIGPGLMRNALETNPFADWCADVADEDAVYRLQYVDCRTMLSDNLLLYGDKMSMSTSLELRVPFLDRAVAELVESMPTRMKVRGRQRKWILRRVAEKWLDQATLTRRKVNFAVPIREWLREDLGRELERLIADDASLSATWLSRSGVQLMLDEHRRGARDHTHVLFSVLTAELWHGEYILRGGAPTTPLGWGARP
jgi:asparagine synthase (glutamine-hydrolysing)